LFLLFISYPRVVVSAKQEIAPFARGAAGPSQDRSQIAGGHGPRGVLTGQGEKLMAVCKFKADA